MPEIRDAFSHAIMYKPHRKIIARRIFDIWRVSHECGGTYDPWENNRNTRVYGCSGNDIDFIYFMRLPTDWYFIQKNWTISCANICCWATVKHAQDWRVYYKYSWKAINIIHVRDRMSISESTDPLWALDTSSIISDLLNYRYISVLQRSIYRQNASELITKLSLYIFLESLALWIFDFMEFWNWKLHTVFCVDSALFFHL